MSDTAKTVLASMLGGTAGGLIGARSKEIPAQAAGTVTLDQDSLSAMLAILDKCENIEQMLQILDSIASSLGAQGGSNPNDWKAFKVFVSAPGTVIHLPEYKIPYKMKVNITALPTNAGTIYIASSAAETTQSLSRADLVAGQSYSLEIDNTNLVYMDGTSANDGVQCVFEQRR
jgi:hypothetical protein